MISGKRLPVLFVGFQPDDERMYPHLKAVIEGLRNFCDVEYYHFPFRGLELLPILVDFHPINWLRRIKQWFFTFSGVGKCLPDLWKALRGQRVIVAIDYFAYALVSCLAPRNASVAYWSFDIGVLPGWNLPTILSKLIYLIGGTAIRRYGKVIVQDQDRWELVRRLHFVPAGAQKPTPFFLPVSLPPVPVPQRSSRQSGKPLLMQLGGLGEWHYTFSLVEYFRQLNPPNFDLVLQGYFQGAPPADSYFRLLNPAVPPGDLWKAVAECDIGFLGYKVDRTCDENAFLIKMASGQLVEFLRLGKPVIVMGDTNLHDLVKQENIGVSITQLNDLEEAMSRICSNYTIYSKNACCCFKKYFDLTRYFPGIVQLLRASGAR